MRAALRPATEAARREALAQYDVLDSPAEAAFDALTELAAALVGTPVALISLVDGDRLWFKSRHGMDVREVPRDISFCGHVVADGVALVVDDAAQDPRFHDNPLVVGEPHVRFYAGVPIADDAGQVLGSLCAVDRLPREITPAQLHGLELLAGQVAALLELRRERRRLAQERHELRVQSSLVELSLDLHGLADAELRLHHLNPAWARVTGWLPSELEGRTLLEFVHPDDLAATLAEARRIADQLRPTVEFEHRFRHREGHYVWLSWTVLSDGQTYYAVGRDSTARREHQELLRAAEVRARMSEARLRAVFEAMAEGVVHQDAAGTIVDCNDAACQVLGLTREQLTGRTSVDPRWHTVDGHGAPFPGERHPAMVALRSGQPLRDVAMGVAKLDGELRWLSINAEPLVSDGVAVSVVTTFRDVTAQRNMANELARERGWLTTLLDNLPGTTVGLFDDALQLSHTFGSSRTVPLPPRVEGIAVAHDAPILREAATRCLAGEHVRVMTRADERQIDIAFVPLPEHDGRQGLMLARDVTEREALRDHIARQERLASVANLAAGVGHQINNPLQAVNTNLDFAAEELRRLALSLPESRVSEIAEALDEARRGSERIRTIVRGLRTITQERGAGRQADLTGAIEFATTLAQHALREVATLELELGALPPVVGDEARIAQALSNLLLNAAESFDAADRDRNRVRVRATVDAGHVSLCIEDNGRGIAPEALAHVFDPFFTTKAPADGPGLGLTIAHSAVRAMGGTLSCESTLGRGSSFTVRLRVGQAPPRSAVDMPAPAAHVVVIDDEPAVLQSLQRTLRRDYVVDAFQDAREALAYLLDPVARPVAVLCDLAMPQVDAERLFRTLSEQRPDLAARFVCMSGDVRQVERPHAFPRDVPWLEKPFAVAELRAVVERLRGRSPLVLAS